ncbi:hypothetical protein ACFVFS_17435 [Kitasatospora sp. NPDC057692]|uniref:hypothetical protein n=1 Tax=Kitasatospora sp. NPDC057692 TaxID=3346215 RepID=UPI00369A8B4A
MLTTPQTHHLRDQLTELPELIAHTGIALLPGAGDRGARVSGATRTPPLPCRLNALDDLGPRRDNTPTLSILASWAATVLDDRQRANDWSAWTVLPVPARAPYTLDSEYDATTATTYLLHHLDYAAGRAYAVDMADEISQLHHHLSRVTGWHRQDRPARRRPCPRCRLLTVVIRPDGMRECSSPDCWAVMSEAEYAAAADRAEHVTAELAAA